MSYLDSMSVIENMGGYSGIPADDKARPLEQLEEPPRHGVKERKRKRRETTTTTTLHTHGKRSVL